MPTLTTLVKPFGLGEIHNRTYLFNGADVAPHIPYEPNDTIEYGGDFYCVRDFVMRLAAGKAEEVQILAAKFMAQEDVSPSNRELLDELFCNKPLERVIDEHERLVIKNGWGPVDLNSVADRRPSDASHVIVPPHIQALLAEETFPLAQSKIDHFEIMMEWHYGIQNPADLGCPSEWISMDDAFAKSGKTYRIHAEAGGFLTGFVYNRLD